MHTRRNCDRFLGPLALCCLLVACSDDGGSPPTSDAAADQQVVDGGADASSLDGAGDLALPAPDAALADSTASGLPTSCSGSCAQQTLSATFGAVTEPLERAIYGIDHDQQGNPRIYIEALNGGFTGCPVQDSPTPDRTLILSGLPLPAAGAPVTKADGLVVSLLDYAGTLSTDLVVKATAASVNFSAANVCPACLGQPAPSHPEGFVALELSATFPGGTVSGHLYAVHCDSLDL